MNTTTLTTASNRVPFFTAYAFKDESENSLTRVSAYFNLSQHATTVQVKENSLTELIIVGQGDLPQSAFMVALKVISYCTVIIPLIMLIIYAIVRSHYTVSSASVSSALTSGQLSTYKDSGSRIEGLAFIQSNHNSASIKASDGSLQLCKQQFSSHLQSVIDRGLRFISEEKGISTSLNNSNQFFVTCPQSALAIRTPTPDGALEVSGSTVSLDSSSKPRSMSQDLGRGLEVNFNTALEERMRELEDSYKEVFAKGEEMLQSSLDASDGFSERIKEAMQGVRDAYEKACAAYEKQIKQNNENKKRERIESTLNPTQRRYLHSKR